MTKANPVNPDNISAYKMIRSHSANTLFNVVACDKKGKILATIKVDMGFEDSAPMVEALNESL